MDINWHSIDDEGNPTEEGYYLLDCDGYYMTSAWDGYDFNDTSYSDFPISWARIA